MNFPVIVYKIYAIILTLLKMEDLTYDILFKLVENTIIINVLIKKVVECEFVVYKTVVTNKYPFVKDYLNGDVTKVYKWITDAQRENAIGITEHSPTLILSISEPISLQFKLSFLSGNAPPMGDVRLKRKWKKCMLHF